MGWTGIGLAGAAYLGMLVRPFLFVYQWNRTLSELLGVSAHFLEWKDAVLPYKVSRELEALGSRSRGIRLNLLSLHY